MDAQLRQQIIEAVADVIHDGNWLDHPERWPDRNMAVCLAEEIVDAVAAKLKVSVDAR
jgi:hypothetical protein